jgi:serine/threonine-protein kinase RsbW
MMHFPVDPNGAVPLERVRVALEIEIPSDIRYIEQIVVLVTRQVEALRYTPRQIALNVPVALSEALSNAILRGNRESPSKTVCVRAAVDLERLVVEVVDQGQGFDLETCCGDPTRPENIAREDGRGLFLMRKLMDRVERFDDRGNVVRMTMHRR